MNPYDELELDPRLSPKELTDVLRRRAERARPEDRHRLQELWRTLTVNEADRLRWAFWAHPRPHEADPKSIDVLRESLPPVIIRSKSKPLDVTVADILKDDRLTVSIAPSFKQETTKAPDGEPHE